MDIDKLSKVIEQKPELLFDKQLLINYLKDYFPNEQMNINLLAISMDAKIPSFIVTNKNNSFRKALVTNKLIDEFGIEKSKALWLANVWEILYKNNPGLFTNESKHINISSAFSNENLPYANKYLKDYIIAWLEATAETDICSSMLEDKKSAALINEESYEDNLIVNSAYTKVKTEELINYFFGCKGNPSTIPSDEGFWFHATHAKKFIFTSQMCETKYMAALLQELGVVVSPGIPLLEQKYLYYMLTLNLILDFIDFIKVKDFYNDFMEGLDLSLAKEEFYDAIQLDESNNIIPIREE